MSSAAQKPESDEMFYSAEQAGLKLAIKGRIVTVVFVTLLMAITRDVERAPGFCLLAWDCCIFESSDHHWIDHG